MTSNEYCCDPRDQVIRDPEDKISKLDNNSTVILLEACTNTRAYGLTKLLGEQLAYANLVGKRKTLSYTTSRAHWDSRDEVGTIKIYKKENAPSVVYLLPNYGPGHPIETNEFKQVILKRTMDTSFADGLKKDTKENRIRAFKKCMEELEKYILSMDKSYNFLFLLSLMLGEVGHHVCYIEYIYY